MSIFIRLILFGLFFTLQSCSDRSAAFNRETFFNEDNDEAIEESGEEIPEVEDVRPSGAVVLKSPACACEAGKSISFNSGECISFCASNVTTEPRLYLSANLTDEIILDNKYVNLLGWCNNEINDGKTNPSCKVQLVDDNGTPTEADVPNDGISANNSFSIPILTLTENLTQAKRFRVKVVEQSSGAQSTTIQILLTKDASDEMELGPLKITPISQYACYTREVLQNTALNDYYFKAAYRLHFYFDPTNRPSPIPYNAGVLFCHDIQLYGLYDNILYPRIDETPGQFSLWDKSDPRFYDLDPNDGKDAIKINLLIEEYAASKGAPLSSTPNLFVPFTWPGSPVANDSAGNGNTPLQLGYMMSAWIDQTTFKAYCPREEQYYSDNPIFEYFREAIGVNTEGLYIARRNPVNITDSNGDPAVAPDDYLLINEYKLKQIWFYLNENMLPIEPTDDNVSGKTVYFYWPPDYDNPYVQKSYQNSYQLLGQDQLPSSATSNTSNSGGGGSNFPPHDKRIGCIPELQN